MFVKVFLKMIIATSSLFMLEAMQPSQEPTFTMKFPISDTLELRGVFIVTIDTSQGTVQVVEVVSESYKVFNKGLLYCEQLNRPSELKCDQYFEENMSLIYGQIKRHKEVLKEVDIKNIGLRFSKGYSIILIPEN